MSARKSLMIGLGLLILHSCIHGARAELIANGSFETGDFFGWTISPNPPGNAAIITNTSQFIGENRVSEGTYAVDFNFNHVPATAVLSQTFATTPGAGYWVSFDFGAIAGGGEPASLQYEVLGADGSTVLDSLAVSLDGSYPSVWTTVDRSFSADGSTATIRFTDTTVESRGCDALLDHVVLTQVSQPIPAPSALVGLVSIGLIGLLGYLRRSRRNACQ